MAGGRRLLNPTLRSNGQPGTQQQQAHQSQRSLPSVASPQYWSGSIWQLPLIHSDPMTNSANSPRLTSAHAPTPPTPPQSSQSSKLAQALDAAVHAAVIRALDAASAPFPLRDDDNTSSASCSSTRSVQPDDGLLARLRSAVEMNSALRARADASETQVNALVRRVEELEAKLREFQVKNEQLEQRSNEITEQSNTLKEQVQSMGKINYGSRGVVERSRVEKSERVSREQTAAVMKRIECAEEALTKQVVTITERLNRLEQVEHNSKKTSERDDEDEERENELGRVITEKALAAIAETLGPLKGRLKRVESIQESQNRFVEENAALESGVIDGVKADATALKKEVVSLKQLIATNLRSHASAESVVKQQVSLITRHVSSALRAHITRRLEDNTKEILEKVSLELRGISSTSVTTTTTATATATVTASTEQKPPPAAAAAATSLVANVASPVVD